MREVPIPEAGLALCAPGRLQGATFTRRQQRMHALHTAASHSNARHTQPTGPATAVLRLPRSGIFALRHSSTKNSSKRTIAADTPNGSRTIVPTVARVLLAHMCPALVLHMQTGSPIRSTELLLDGMAIIVPRAEATPPQNLSSPPSTLPNTVVLVCGVPVASSCSRMTCDAEAGIAYTCP